MMGTHCCQFFQEGHTPLFKAALQGDEITHELSLALLVAAGLMMAGLLSMHGSAAA